MKVLVCGGRNYSDEQAVFDFLDTFNDQITSVVVGGAQGVDGMAAKWALKNLKDVYIYVAEWEKYGKRAGPIRNAKMLEKHPDIEHIIAFPGGRGTADMVRQGKNKNISILEIK